MRIVAVRSGVVEARHEVTWAAVRDGAVIDGDGDIDEVFFYRSAVKPFQATACLEAGLDLGPEAVAVACASHGGHPVHVATVRDMLARAGLDEGHLQCPEVWPLAAEAGNRLRLGGTGRPRRIYHNCSGKHAAMLGACVAAGWPTATYLEPDHPLQRTIFALVGEATGLPVAPTGVDGCGAPTLRGSVRALAAGFARLTSDRRYAAAASAMSRFPALTGDNLRLDGRFGAWWGGPVKVGAVGSIGAGRHGTGIAVKSRDGDPSVAMVGMMEAARRLGLVPAAMEAALTAVARPPLLGGGRPVGELRPQ